MIAPALRVVPRPACRYSSQETVEDGIVRDRRAPGSMVHRHRHSSGYVAVVLAGGYEEAGYEGRHTVRPGDVLIHHAFDTHLDRIGTRGADILNVTLPPGRIDMTIHAGCLADPDAIVCTMENDPRDGLSLLLERLQPAKERAQDWPDLLQQKLADGSRRTLSDHARAIGVRRETVARGFAKLYGVAPAAFRAENRARRAWRRIIDDAIPLSAIAQDEGFADQAHMTRAVVALTGEPPSAWRKSHSFKTGASGLP